MNKFPKLAGSEGGLSVSIRDCTVMDMFFGLLVSCVTLLSFSTFGHMVLLIHIIWFAFLKGC